MTTVTSAPNAGLSPAPSSPDQTNTVTPSPEANQGIIPVTGEINPGRLSHLLELDVINPAGEKIGKVHDMILDLDTSFVEYVVVSTGEILDIAGKNIAVPWKALEIQTDARSAAASGFVFVLLVDQGVFDNAPVMVMESDLPGLGQPAGNWDQQIRTYWNLHGNGANLNSPPAGTPPIQETPQGIPLRGIILANDALGFDFKLQGQEPLDVSIDDMILDIESGEILYVVIHTNFENASEQWTPVPLALLEWDISSRAFVLDRVDVVTLQEAPSYFEGRYPNTTIPGWDELYVFFWNKHGLNREP